MRFLLNVSDAHQKFIIQDRKKFDCTLHGYGMDTELKKMFRVAAKKIDVSICDESPPGTDLF